MIHKVFKMFFIAKFMYVLPHVIFSGLLTLAAYPFFGVASLLVFIGGVLIDVDHYLEYAFRTKNISPFKAYKDYMKMNKEYFDDLKNKRIPKRGCFLHVFHTIELWIVIILISFFSRQYLFLYGLMLHMSMDTAFYVKNKIIYKDLAGYGRPISLIQYYLKKSNYHQYI